MTVGSSFEFEPWPKIARLNRDITITEKIDGTNAAIIIRLPDPEMDYWTHSSGEGNSDVDGAVETGYRVVGHEGQVYIVGAQSRKRLIVPEIFRKNGDNRGFAQWVYDNASELVRLLGVGRHFGEWWGSGIQRGYDLPKGEKRFSLFNTARYADIDLSAVPGLGLVPVIYQGPFSQDEIESAVGWLDAAGSFASPGFQPAEGVIVFHSAANVMFKVTIKDDEVPKSVANRA